MPWARISCVDSTLFWEEQVKHLHRVDSVFHFLLAAQNLHQFAVAFGANIKNSAIDGFDSLLLVNVILSVVRVYLALDLILGLQCYHCCRLFGCSDFNRRGNTRKKVLLTLISPLSI